MSTNYNMGTGKLKIENGKIEITPVAGNVWMTAHEIALFFNVFVMKVTSNIRSILKDELLWEKEVVKWIDHPGSITVLYNLEMITALSYRIKTMEAKIYRQWVCGRITKTHLVWRLPHNNSLYS